VPRYCSVGSTKTIAYFIGSSGAEGGLHARTTAGNPDRSEKGSRKQICQKKAIEVIGVVVEKFKAGLFGVEIDPGKTVLAAMAGRLRRNRIKIMTGDRVSVELSPYDLTRGRITYRHK